ncbi:MAG TPA: PIG-L family deacetylase, partial [Terriglobales bacterium]|nr:PIG-L family deacetylase [Terriglobales bacterium]
MDAGSLAHALDRLSHSGRVLYVAAHPDDENTRLLSYLANQRHLTVAYLSMTRGGGGQNLIGREQDELLDVIRTEELLAARAIDSAQQRFTRMRDFGFSKSAEETLRIWGHDEALADVVWVVRTFQPEVIIARFNELPPNHGHHTASAILAREAFTAAADSSRFPEQLAHGATAWRADRLLLNVPTWTDTQPPADALVLDVGGYDPRLGLGYAELAARSRSQHKSQGFGVAAERGSILERFVSIAGTRPQSDILEGLPLAWENAGEGAAQWNAALARARAQLTRDEPERAVPALLEARTALARMAWTPRTVAAARDLDRLIAAAAGLFARATAAQPVAVAGSTVSIKTEIVARRPVPITLLSLRAGDSSAKQDAALGLNQRKEIVQEVSIAAGMPISMPYWLAEPSLPGRQVVGEQTLVGQPRGPSPLEVVAELKVAGGEIRLALPVVHAWTDPVQGERVRTFLIVPPATVTPLRGAFLFPERRPGEVLLRVRAERDGVAGRVSLALPDGWRSTAPAATFALARAGDETVVRFELTPAADAGIAEVRPTLSIDGSAQPSQSAYRADTIDYPHIPLQTVLQPARLRLVPLALQLPAGPIGYIPGSGDSVAEDLAHAGLVIETIDDEMLRAGDLSRYRAILTGVRAYNTNPLLGRLHQRLMHYVETGGTLVVQYNTNNRLAPLTAPIGPHAFEIGRERITDETARVEPIEPEHVVLRQPNRIAAEDFSGWVQERGLYYATRWDDAYQTVLRAADPNEPPLAGGLLVAK